MRGEFVDVIEVKVEFDEAGERGLVERIGDNGAHERLAGVVGGVDVDEALRDGEEVFGAEAGLIEVVGEQEAGALGVAESEVGDGLEAVEDGGEARGPIGVVVQQIAGGVEGAMKITRDDEGLHGEDGVWFPSKMVRAGELGELASERDIAGIGGEIGEREERAGIVGKVADKRIDLAGRSGVLAGVIVGAQQFDAWPGQRGVRDLEGEGGATDFIEQTGAVEVRGEFGMDFGVVGKSGGKLAEAEQGEVAVAALAFDFRDEEASIARVREGGLGTEEVFREIVVTAKIAGRGGCQRVEVVAFGGGRLAREIFSRDGDNTSITLVLEEERKKRTQVVRVVVLVGQSVEENLPREFGAAGFRQQLREEQAAVAVRWRQADSATHEQERLKPLASGRERGGDRDAMIAASDAHARPPRRHQKIEVADCRHLLLIPDQKKHPGREREIEAQGAGELGRGNSRPAHAQTHRVAAGRDREQERIEDSPPILELDRARSEGCQQLPILWAFVSI